MNEEEWKEARKLIVPSVGGFGGSKEPTKEDIENAVKYDLLD